jgi:hypothetical protein
LAWRRADVEIRFFASAVAMSAYHIDRPKQEVGPWLAAGILFLPVVFAWATLQRGFSDRARGVSFTWMFCVCGLIALAIFAIIWPSLAPAGDGGETALNTPLRVALAGLPTRNGKISIGGHPVVVNKTGGGIQFLDDLEHSRHRHDCPRDQGYLLDISAKSGELPIDDARLMWSDQPLDISAEADQPQILFAHLTWRSLANCVGDGAGSDGHEGGFALGHFSNVSFTDWPGPNYVEGGGGGPGGNPPGGGGNPPGGGDGPGGNPPGGGDGPGGNPPGGGPGDGPGSGPSGGGGPNGPWGPPGGGPGGPGGPSDPPNFGAPGDGPGDPPWGDGPGGDGPDTPPINGLLPIDTGGPGAGVPEPADWIMMICGTFLLGLVMRRRRNLSAAE